MVICLIGYVNKRDEGAARRPLQFRYSTTTPVGSRQSAIGRHSRITTGEERQGQQYSKHIIHGISLTIFINFSYSVAVYDDSTGTALENGIAARM